MLDCRPAKSFAVHGPKPATWLSCPYFCPYSKECNSKISEFFIENHSIRISWNKIYPVFRIQNFARWFWVGSRHIFHFLQNVSSDFLPNGEKWKLLLVNHFSLSDIINLILCIDSFFVSLSPMVTSCLHGSGKLRTNERWKIVKWRVELFTRECNWDSLSSLIFKANCKATSYHLLLFQLSFPFFSFPLRNFASLIFSKLLDLI